MRLTTSDSPKPDNLLDPDHERTLPCLPGMAWAVPEFSRTKVDAAGDILIREFSPIASAGDMSVDDYVDQYEDFQHELTAALQVINNWRSCHSYPLNALQMSLRRRVRNMKTAWLVAQRIKRLPAIQLKLRINKGMQLSRMQDIGGCRAVVSTVRMVNHLVSTYQGSKSMKHELVRITDYIEKPRPTGYRSVHLIYRHQSETHQEYNNLRIEMQIRSRLQHAWATAVETIGEFIGQALKSNLGEANWLRFFQLMSSAAPCPATPPRRADLIKELRHLTRTLRVEETLQTFGTLAERRVGTAGADLFLIATNPARKTVDVTGFPLRESEKAMERYSDTERSFAGTAGAQVVLVSVDSLEKLRRAYPSYFLESRVFTKALKEALRG